MRRLGGMSVTVSAICLAACQRTAPVQWFEGDLEAALAEAGARRTVVMAEFYTEWCGWCRRLEADTLSKPEVRRELESIVSLRLDAEREGAELAERFGVDSYPTLVFLDPEGREVERILGYLPPDTFLRRVQRIRAGDTFLASLRRLQAEPDDPEAVVRSVEGLLERSDPEGAISRIEDFHRATGGRRQEVCRELMFAARAELHSRSYQRAAELYRRGWHREFEVPDTAGAARLRAAVDAGLATRPPDEQAALLRAARFEDAGEVLAIPDLDATPVDEVLPIADFAYRNGHYALAAGLYRRWFVARGDEAGADNLNDVAWRLYLAGVELETAAEMARRAFDAKPDPEIADTLARIVYRTGARDEALALEARAAEGAEGSRRDAFLETAARMASGEPLGDRPTFEDYPGRRQGH